MVSCFYVASTTVMVCAAGFDVYNYVLPVLCPKKVSAPAIASRLVSAVACTDTSTVVFART